MNTWFCNIDSSMKNIWNFSLHEILWIKFFQRAVAVVFTDCEKSLFTKNKKKIELSTYTTLDGKKAYKSVFSFKQVLAWLPNVVMHTFNQFKLVSKGSMFAIHRQRDALNYRASWTSLSMKYFARLMFETAGGTLRWKIKSAKRFNLLDSLHRFCRYFFLIAQVYVLQLGEFPWRLSELDKCWKNENL